MNQKKGLKGYSPTPTLLSRILQRIESNHSKCCSTVSEEKPDLPIFTIHDSIATTVGNESYVAEIFRQELLGLTGLQAKLGVEFWDFDE